VTAAVRLAPEDLELLAERVAELVLDRMGGPPVTAANVELVDAAEIARRFNLTAATVRARADEFGAIRLPSPPNPKRKGDPRPRLRFDPERVAAALGAGDLLHPEQASRAPESPAQPAVRHRRRRARTGTGPELLPIRGVRAP
jgi:hypothetical protein